ncbi:MAG TPA: class I SAM-dependent methyltransferase [Verrucomicrobiae bacterium]|nr:class I SAM-dependent methyltransferase [Verrucomicrobiae bacterium]
MNARLEHEIAHGRYLIAHGAGEIWNWEGAAGHLRWQRRVQMLRSHLQPEMDVLELGCGTGLFTAELAKTGARITAVDISPELLEVARLQCQSANVRFVIQNAYALDYADASFDSVLGSSVLHHLELDQALTEAYRVLRPGGHFRFTEPNMLNPQIAIQKNIPAVKRRLGDSPDETAFFRWSLQRRLGRIGFRQIKVKPFDFLHPKLPPRLIPAAQALERIVERTPVLSEIAGSLFIRAVK